MIKGNEMKDVVISYSLQTILYTLKRHWGQEDIQWNLTSLYSALCNTDPADLRKYGHTYHWTQKQVDGMIEEVGRLLIEYSGACKEERWYNPHNEGER